jgi:crotonobetainyl-CoA:carnitine CoA-transferase CaiB-like acyl-CoA transferase
VRELDQFLRVSQATAPPHRLAPELGEHTEEILASLGYDRDTIAALAARGAIR